MKVRLSRVGRGYMGRQRKTGGSLRRQFQSEEWKYVRQKEFKKEWEEKGVNSGVRKLGVREEIKNLRRMKKFFGRE